MANGLNFRRWTVIATSAASAVAAAWVIYFLFISFTKYRAVDFLTASQTQSFESLGSCVSAISSKQLKSANWNKDRDCDAGTREAYANSVLVSVHGIYYAYFVANVQTISMARAAETALAAVTKKTGVTEPTLRPLNTTLIYEVLNDVANLPTYPVKTCAMIYPGAVFDDIYAARLMKTDVLTSQKCSELDTTEEAASPSCSLESPVADLKDVIHVPGTESGCNTYAADVGVFDDFDLSGKPTGTVLNHLFTHCEQQFRYHSSAVKSYSGSFGMPFPGADTDPTLPSWYGNNIGYKSSVPYDRRVRIQLGMRFASSCWAYAPLLMTAAFLLGDAVVFFLAEATAQEAMIEGALKEGQTLEDRRNYLLTMRSTTASVRGIRFGFGLHAVILSVSLWAYFLAAPYGLGETTMLRPECETGEPEHDYNIFRGIIPWFRGTTGGWKADFDANSYELISIIILVLILFLLPASTTGFGGLLRFFTFGRVTKGSTKMEAKREGPIASDRQSLFFQELLLLPLLLGIFLAIIGQVIGTFQFGYSWAEGVLEFTEYAALFDPKTLMELVVEQAICAFVILLVAGLLLGVTVARWTINGKGRIVTFVFFVWLILVVLSCLPLLLYSERQPIFATGKAYEDCDDIYSSRSMSREICRSRYWTLLVGGGLALLIIGIMICVGCFRHARDLCAAQSQSYQKLRPDGRRLVMEASKNDEQEEAANNVFSVSGYRTYRSKSQPFFNFETRSKEEELAQLLRAPTAVMLRH